MAAEMKVGMRLIKALREERAWSQEHLASVAGLSARTAQRLEADGNPCHLRLIRPPKRY